MPKSHLSAWSGHKVNKIAQRIILTFLFGTKSWFILTLCFLKNLFGTCTDVSEYYLARSGTLRQSKYHVWSEYVLDTENLWWRFRWLDIVTSLHDLQLASMDLTTTLSQKQDVVHESYKTLAFIFWSPDAFISGIIPIVWTVSVDEFHFPILEFNESINITGTSMIIVFDGFQT